LCPPKEWEGAGLRFTVQWIEQTTHVPKFEGSNSDHARSDKEKIA
jgi:hypothetical protein